MLLLKLIVLLPVPFIVKLSLPVCPARLCQSLLNPLGVVTKFSVLVDVDIKSIMLLLPPMPSASTFLAEIVPASLQ